MIGSPIVDDMATGQRELIGYLLNGPGGTCVFFDSETRLCTIHNTRPGCCRLFDCDAVKMDDDRHR
jgi:Fe-S-cluster containining protein